MASLSNRIGVDVLAIILDHYLDIKSKLRFERTSKEHQQLVIESFQRIKKLCVSQGQIRKMSRSEVIKLIFRCGPNTTQFDIYSYFFLNLNVKDSEIVAMANQFPLLIELPTVSFHDYCIYVEEL